jgi:enoyl-CoA hydratase/carnithine racemase
MFVNYEKKGRIAYFTLNRPEAHNAFNPEMLKELSDCLVDFKQNDDLWVGILTGAGERAFSAGADVKTMLSLICEEWQFNPSLMPPTIVRGLELYKPMIAAINGIALGGGLEFALACDIRVAAEKAILGQPEGRLGLIPGWGGTCRLPRVVPWAKAAEMLLTGDFISAQEALRIGLVNEVVPLPELMPAAERWAERIIRNGPLAVRAAKEIMLKSLNISFEECLKLEWERFGQLYHTEDSIEARQAFFKKKKPEFKGR